MAPRSFRNLDALLSLGTTPERARETVRRLDPEDDWVRVLGSHPLATQLAKQRLGAIDPTRHDDLHAQGVRDVWEAEYPEALVEAPGSPPGFFLRGDPQALGTPCVGIVGTRHASAYGKACAMKFAEAFARAGVTVVSGGAVGIDTAAHEGALAAGGRTIACMATGIDGIYPSVNAALFDRIRDKGALLSQFAIGTAPLQAHFLIRNGLIAALSLGVLVIEAPLKSGSMRTAMLANEYGREVFVVPGTIDRFAFEGSHALLRDGATFATHPDHILEYLGIEPVDAVVSPVAEGAAATILAALSADAIPIETIVERTGLGAGEVLSEMTMLELDGRVVRGGGGYALKL